MTIYLYLLLGALSTALVLNHYFSLRIFSRWAGLLAGLGTASLSFLVWDVFATRDGHWSFNEEYILGPKLLGLPLEEILFFIIIPFVMTVIWLVVRKNVKKSKVDVKWLHRTVFVSLALSAYMSIYRPYTFMVTAIGVLFWLVITRTNFMNTRRFWVFQIWLFALFLVSNTILTQPPVVSYADSAIMGLRVGTIPIEDFLYNFILINGFVLAFTKVERLRD